MPFHPDQLLLYAVTDRAWTGRQTLLEQLEAALQGGVTLVQLREKDLDPAAFLAEALEVKALCRPVSRPPDPQRPGGPGPGLRGRWRPRGQ